MKIDPDAVSDDANLSEQDSVAIVKDSTTPLKVTQTTPAPPVPSIFSVPASKQRRILVRAIVLLLLAVAAFLIWPGPQKAGELCQKAIAHAQFTLGRLYEKRGDVPEDLDKATELYQKAADRGNAGAQFNLGLLYEKGEGVPKDLGRAAELYQKAADQGNANAQYNLGLLYENGEGVPKDLVTARELYQKAADQGYEPANEKLKALPEPRK
jgi:TPR repeat protein